MDKIKCQSCVSNYSEHGCYTCGGYGYILYKDTCSCGKGFWTRPGCFTSYVGKQWMSFDGVLLTVQSLGKDFRITCDRDCVPKKKKKRKAKK